jgi:carbonic anhydrase
MRLPDRLSEGYRAFIETRLPLERSRFERLAAAGQRPDVMLIGCCDSRVAPDFRQPSGRNFRRSQRRQSCAAL